jgi:hypothetical protein
LGDNASQIEQRFYRVDAGKTCRIQARGAVRDRAADPADGPGRSTSGANESTRNTAAERNLREAQVIVAKTADHLPLHRQEKIFERHGVNMAATEASASAQHGHARWSRPWWALHSLFLALEVKNAPRTREASRAKGVCNGIP